MAVPASESRHPLYMVELMKRLGIDPSEGVVARLSLSYATAVHRCEACPAKQECHDWLDSAPQSVPFAPRFCPNADIMFELQVNQPCIHHPSSPSEPDRKAEPHAYLSDLERLEDEIDAVLLCQSIDDELSIELKRRQSQLCDEIEALRHQAAADKPAG